MRKFKSMFGEVDLDDPKTYKHLSNTWRALDALMFKEIGYALVYMNYFKDRRDMFPTKKEKPDMVKSPYSNKKIDMNNSGYYQRIRVNKLIQKFADNRQKVDYNLMWLKEQIFLFQQETENMI